MRNDAHLSNDEARAVLSVSPTRLQSVRSSISLRHSSRAVSLSLSERSAAARRSFAQQLSRRGQPRSPLYWHIAVPQGSAVPPSTSAEVIDLYLLNAHARSTADISYRCRPIYKYRLLSFVDKLLTVSLALAAGCVYHRNPISDDNARHLSRVCQSRTSRPLV